MTSIDINNIIENTEFGLLVQTADGSLTIRHAGHGQDFHSQEGAMFEAWQLYVMTSGFYGALRDGQRQRLVLLDVGMGLGYNAAATVVGWLESAGLVEVEMFSFEVDDRLVEAFCSGEAPWQRGWPVSWLAGSRCLKKSGQVYSGQMIHPNSGKSLTWRVYIGDAMDSDFSDCKGRVDYIWQDPFTPELNPSMWSTEWFLRLRTVANESTVLVSYSVARIVKAALEGAGWRYERVPTPGRKRHWLKAYL